MGPEFEHNSVRSALIVDLTGRQTLAKVCVHMVYRSLALVTLLGAGLAFAQEAPVSSVPGVNNADPSASLQKDSDEEDPANAVPSTKYLETAQSSVESMRASLTKGLDELKDAREKKDAVQLTCVNEQVTAMKGILRVSEDAMVSLQEALAANDTERSRYEFRKIQVSKRKMDDLLQAAVNCAGAEATESNTSVQMEIDPNLATIDPYYGDPSFFFDPSSSLVEGGTGTLQGDDPAEPIPPASGTF